MNKLIAKLYEQAIVIEDGGDYVCGELDPVKFAELIVRECMSNLYLHGYDDARTQIKQHLELKNDLQNSSRCTSWICKRRKPLRR